MTKPHALTELQSSLTQALSSLSREELVEILTSVMQAYVAESAPRAEGPPGARLVADLAQVSFAQVITELQLALGQPEWAALRVEGMSVLVRVQGQWVPLVPPPATASAAPASASPAVPPSAPPAPAATATVAATPPVATAQAVATPDPAAKESAAPGGADRFSLLELD